ncbi:MEDS domain-containing protein [uncultured Mycobacterium sp.]|uniref:MEDS domain-containing protein n=1 Tax=uncultured Mycobacterium sp. TaxID=171292 RepID=UPI0035CBE31B
MRQHGAVRSAAGMAPFGHLGWGYRDRAEFLCRASEYITVGLRHKQRIAYAAEGTRETLYSELATMPAIREHLDSGLIEVLPADEYYPYHPGSDVIDADRAVDKYLAAAEDAIVNGYTGFRAVSDVTPVARTTEQRDALAALEYLVDQKMAVLPFSALCGYDTTRVGRAASELICLHPFVGRGSVMFRIYAQPVDGIDFALIGEVDDASDELFATTLQRTLPLVADRTVNIDAQELQFIGHEQMLLLDECARQHNRNVRLCTDQPVVTRLVGLLNLTNVELAPAPVYPSRDAAAGLFRRPRHGERPASQAAINRVKRILKRHFGIRAQQAFVLLVRLAQDTNTTVWELAEQISAELGGEGATGIPRATLDALEAVHHQLWPPSPG